MYDKFLSAKSGIYGHQQHHIKVGQNIFEQQHRCVRIEGYGRFHAGFFDFLDHTMQMGACFVVDVHHISACGSYLRYEFLGFNNHQMHIQRFASCFFYEI
jgi:hypothetical protein